MDRVILSRHGIDYEKGLSRCMDDAAFYELLLIMFLKDDSFAQAKAAYEANDHQALFRAMHELKGAVGNASMTELFNAVCPLVELLRGKAEPDRQELDRLFAAAEAAYTRACEGITLALGK